ncbi:MAG: hypothetical protein ACI9N9_000107, partial [Enterobacterales bacterium]
ELLNLERAGKKGNKQYNETAANLRKVGKAAKQGDKDLKRIDKQYGDGFRNVGNYKSALGGLKNAMLQLGLGFGVFQGLRAGIDVLTEFDEKVADIQKTTGLNREQASGLSQGLFDIDTKTSIENLQELVEAGGRLNIQGIDNLKVFAESADKVFVALGDDLEGSADEIATNLGKIAANFGLEEEFGIGKAIEKVGSGINQLAATSKASAPAILDFTNRMAGLASVVDLADVQALGAFFDEGGQSVEVAASTLNKLLPALSKDFEKFAETAGLPADEFKKLAEEAPIEALKAVALGARNNEKGLFNLTSTLESFGVENARAVSIVGLLTNNTERLTELQLISNEAITDGTSVLEEFDTKNDTLSATLAKASKKIKEQVIAFSESTGAAEGLKNAISFITNNLGAMASIMGKVIKTYIAYKVVSKSLKLIDQFKNWKNVNKAIGNNEKVTKEATKSSKAFGGALKSIGFAAAAAALQEYITRVWAAVYGTKALEEATDRLNKSLAIGSKRAADRAESRQSKLSSDLAELERKFRRGEIKDETELAELKKKASDANQQAIQNDINGSTKTLNLRQKQFAMQKQRFDLIKDSAALTAAEAAENVGGTSLLTASQKELLRIQDEFAQSEVNLNTAKEVTRLYNEELQGTFESAKDLSTEIEVLNGVVSGSSGAVAAKKELITELGTELDLMKELNDEYKEYVSVQDRLKVEQVDQEIKDLNSSIEEITEALKAVSESGEQADTSELEALIDKRKQLELDKIEAVRDAEIAAQIEVFKIRFEDLRLNAQKEAEELIFAAEGNATAIKKIQEDFVDEMDKIDVLELSAQDTLNAKIVLSKEKANGEILEIEKGTAVDVNAVKNELNDLTTKAIQDEADREIQIAEDLKNKEDAINKTRFENAQKWIKAGSDALLELQDARIKNSNDLEEAEKRVRDQLIANSDKGIADGQKSIAKQNEQIAKAQAEQIRLEKEKQAIEFATAAILTFTKALEAGKTVPQAFGEVALTQGGLSLILNQLPKFFHGSEDTGTQGMFNDKYGAVTGVTHKNEGVLNAEMNSKKKKAGFTNSSMLDAAIKYNDIESNPQLAASMLGGFPMSQLASMPKTVAPMFVNQNDDLKREIQQTNTKLDKVTKAIENQEFPEIELGAMFQQFMTIIQRNGKGREEEYLIQPEKQISRSTRKPNYKR